VADEASRDLARTRDDASHELQTAQVRRNACLLRHAIREPGRATWKPSPGAAITSGGGNRQHRRCRARHVRSSMTCNHVNLSRQWPPRPTGWGQRTSTSTVITSFPSPMTTTHSKPSIPRQTRCTWPLHHVPTKPSCRPYFVKSLSSPIQVHCHRLRVAGLLSSTCHHNRTKPLAPDGANAAATSAWARRPRCDPAGSCLSPEPDTPHGSCGNHKQEGNSLRTILPKRFCGSCRHHCTSAATVSGSPSSCSARSNARRAC
jgi:hypothetical protein